MPVGLHGASRLPLEDDSSLAELEEELDSLLRDCQNLNCFMDAEALFEAIVEQAANEAADHVIERVERRWNQAASVWGRIKSWWKREPAQEEDESYALEDAVELEPTEDRTEQIEEHLTELRDRLAGDPPATDHLAGKTVLEKDETTGEFVPSDLDFGDPVGPAAGSVLCVKEHRNGLGWLAVVEEACVDTEATCTSYGGAVLFEHETADSCEATCAQNATTAGVVFAGCDESTPPMYYEQRCGTISTTAPHEGLDRDEANAVCATRPTDNCDAANDALVADCAEPPPQGPHVDWSITCDIYSISSSDPDLDHPVDRSFSLDYPDTYCSTCSPAMEVTREVMTTGETWLEIRWTSTQSGDWPAPSWGWEGYDGIYRVEIEIPDYTGPGTYETLFSHMSTEGHVVEINSAPVNVEIMTAEVAWADDWRAGHEWYAPPYHEYGDISYDEIIAQGTYTDDLVVARVAITRDDETGVTGTLDFTGPGVDVEFDPDWYYGRTNDSRHTCSGAATFTGI